MIVNRPVNKDYLVVDLNGPDGNAYYLIGLAKRLCNTFGIPDEHIVSDMVSGDYEHLVNVFDRNFGSFVTLYR